MRFLLYIIIFFNLCLAANIDTKLFETPIDNSYLQEIEKKIINSKKSDKILLDEKKYLKILKEAANKSITIEEFDYSIFKKENFTLNKSEEVIKFLLILKHKKNENEKLLVGIQDTLSYLKKKIENVIEIEKDNLLVYQLQFAYYKIEKSNLEKRDELLQNEIEKLLSNFSKKIPQITDESTNIELLINKNIENLDRLHQYINSLEIDLQREKLNENKSKINTIKNSISKLELDYQENLIHTIFNLSKKLIVTLKEKEEKIYLATFKTLNEYLSKLNETNKKTYGYLTNIFKELSKDRLSNTKLLLANSTSNINSIYSSSKSFLHTPLVVFNEQAITPISLLKALILIIIGFFVGKIYKKWLLKISSRWPNISEMSLKITSNVGFYLIIFITFMIAISSLGIDMSSISLIAGALSIGIGFGLQTVVSNFIAGIILMFERTIRIGDVIEINDVLKGTVTDIRVRSTSIKTFDNIDIVVPNSSFIQNNVINWTLEDKSRRLHVPFGVAYGTKIEKVKEVVLDELINSDLKYIRDDENKKPEVRFENMNNSSVDLELLVWIRVNDKITPNSLKSDFLLLIYNALYKNNIEIPFPQLDLHIKKELKK